MTHELRRAIYELRKTIDLIERPAPATARIEWVEQAEQEIAEIRAIVEASRMRQAIKERYGEIPPASIADWWQR